MNLFQWQKSEGRDAKRSRANRRRKVVATFNCESLEARQLLATRVWTGLAEFVISDSHWSNPVNWDTGAPVNGDDLIFPGTALSKTSSNNLANLSVNSVSFTTSGYDLTGSTFRIGAGGASSSNGTNFISADLQLAVPLSVDVSAGSLFLAGDLISVGGTQGVTKTGAGTVIVAFTSSSFDESLTVNSGNARIDGQIGLVDVNAGVTTVNTTGTATVFQVHGGQGVIQGSVGTARVDGGLLTVQSNVFESVALLNPSGSGTAEVFGDVDFTLAQGGFTEIFPGGFSGFVQGNGGTVLVNGTSGPVLLGGGIVGGNGTTGSVTGFGQGGSISPGNSPGILNVVGNFTLNAADNLTIELDGTAVGAEYDQVNVTGPVTLNSPTLINLLSFVPGVNDTFTIINNDGTDAVAGSFLGLPQGAFFDLNGIRFRINYSGGDGNDVVLAVNGPPVAGNDTYSLPQYSTINPTFFVPAPGVLGNDSDPNGDTLVPVLLTSPANGTLALFNDGSFSYTPAPGFTGVDTFTYQDSDGDLLSNVATVTLFVNPTLFAPIANDNSYSVLGNATTAIAAPGVLNNDVSPQGLVLTAEIVANATQGVVTLNADGSFNYTPVTGFVGTDSFTYLARDSNGLGSNIATVTINVGVNNVAPVAVNDAFSTVEGKTLSVVSPGVLSNDTDANPGDTLTSFLITGPTNGTLSLRGDGSFDYTPDPTFNGVDTFTYRVSDGSLNSATDATVTITVGPVNNAPVSTNDSYTGTEDTPLVIAAPGVLANDTDADGDALTAVLVNGPQHGTLALAADGSFTYTPFANYNGPDSFTYIAQDATLSSGLATVDLTITAVNDLPVAVNDGFSGTEDTVLTVAAPGVLQNDTDTDGDALSAVLINGPVNGSIVLNSDGSFAYTPFPNFNGNDSFTYRVSDGNGLGNIATVALTIGAVNDAPVATNDQFHATESTPLVIPATGVLANDTDADGDALTAVLVNGAQHGTVTLNADGSFTYTPDTGYTGTDFFTYRASDGNAVNGLSNLATVTINITAVNQTPVAVNDAFTGNEDTPLIVAAPGVIQNDTDADGDTLFSVLVDAPTNGSVVLNSDGSFTYTPYANYFGADSFTYRVSDGSTFSNVATVSLTILSVNDAPVATDDAYTITEDGVLTIAAPGVLVNDTDTENDALSAVLVNGPLHGTLTLGANGAFVYTPEANYHGTDTFTYRADDGQAVNNLSNLATVNITITPVNDVPVAVADAYSVNANTVLSVSNLGVVQNDTDLDGDTLVAAMIDGPTHGVVVLNANGSFTYTPTPFYFGTDSFTYRVTDGTTFSNTATVTLTVNFVNSNPVGVADSYTVLEDTTLVVPIAAGVNGVLANDSDPDNPLANQILSAQIVNGPLHGTLTLNADGSFSYTPTLNYTGPDSFTYQVNDGAGGLSNITPVSINVVPVNHAPVAVNDAYTTNEDVALFGAFLGVAQNDTDIDGDALIATIVTGPLHGSVTLNSDGSFTYTPVANYNGVDTFTYRVSDGSLFSNIATVSLTILPVPDAPTANPDSYQLLEDQPLTIAAPGVLINDLNPDGGPLDVVVVNGPLHGTLSIADDGSFTYTPSAQYFGTDFFTYYLQQPGVNGLRSNSTTVSLTIQAVNDIPVANDDAYSTAEDTVLTVPAPGVLQNDTDNDDGDSLSAVLQTGPLHGTVVLNTNGSFTYTPFTNYNGLDSFTYRASDGKSLSNIATVTITVTPVPDAPIAVNDAYTLNEDTTLNIAPPGVLINDINVDNTPLTITVVNGPLHGTLTIQNDGSFSYTPQANYFGSDFFTYFLTQTGPGGLRSGTARVDLTILPINDAPTVVDQTYSTNESIKLEVSSPGVLFGASDIDGDKLSSFIVDGPLHGTVSLQSNGAFLYQPDIYYNGPDRFTFRAFDGKLSSNLGTINVNVIPVATPPSAGNDNYTTQADERLVVGAPAGLLANDFNIDGQPMTVVLVTPTLHGTLQLGTDGTFIYTPDPQFVGVDSFAYRASNGVNQSNLAIVTITVTPKIATTVQLDPNSDTGESSTDRITNDNTPTFFGTTIPNLRVLLYAQASGASAPNIVGVTTADSQGNYVVTSIPLADGTYRFFTEALRADGLSTGRVDAGLLTIDTVAPRVTSTILNPKTGQIYVGYEDVGAGLSVISTLDVNNYVFLRKPLPQLNTVISATRGLPLAGRPKSQTVVLRVRNGKAVVHGRYLFQIISGGVSDVAGNALDGEYIGRFPSGNGVAGGNFKGEFLNGGTFRRTTVAFPDFIPVVTQGSLPGGPVTHTKAVKKGK